MNMPWSGIVVTCSNVTWSRVLVDALLNLRNQNKIRSFTRETVVLAATDPGVNIGSGTATLNALFVVTEYLSAQKDYTTITSDVLQNANILILHHARNYAYDVSGKGIVNIPACNGPSFEVQTNLEHLVTMMSSLKNKTQNCGIWVCGTDTSFACSDNDIELTEDTFSDCTLFTVNSDVNHASYHGVVVSDSNNLVENVCYCADEEYLGRIARNDQVQIVSGVVHFSIAVAEKLLSFHTLHPLSCCTYLGVDAGSDPLRISLFFDILVAMIRNITEEDYLSGRYGNLYNVKTGLDTQSENQLYAARKVIWAHLSRFSLKSVTLHNLKHCYWDERMSAVHHIQNLLSFGTFGCLQSFVDSVQYTPNPKTLIINSSIKCQSLNIGFNSVVCNSEIRAGKVTIGDNCLLSSVSIDLPSSYTLSVLDNFCVLGFKSLNSDMPKTTAIFGTKDDLHREINITEDKFCNIPWNDFLKITGLSLSDVWGEAPKTLWNAKIFSDQIDVNFYIKTSLGNYQELPAVKFQEFTRFSLQQLVRDTDVEKEVEWRKKLRSDVICLQIAESLESNTNKSFLDFFKLACTEGWHEKILRTLDRTAEKLQNSNFEFCRTLSCIADLLGTMAGTMGRVRSGPGNNKAWISAFEHFRKGERGVAITALKEMREKWMGLNQTIRAARHYESALQIFIQNAVKTAVTFIHLKSCSLPAIGQWVLAECPARVDLQGGWSDTPPICYEQGGSVVNVAILIDGKKSVGAKARRTDKKTLSFKMINQDFSNELEIQTLEGLSDFNQVYANSALLKACIVCAELVDLNSTLNLQEQLEKFQGGFELCAWSNLPQGSGLGTSSILAGAIIAALWTASGRTYTKSSILHAVLYLEQLLTSGGGWQDQVGGILGGVNRGFSEGRMPMEIKVEPIDIKADFLATLNDHLFLIYTGKVRLAKNLLQNVIRNWYAREENIVNCFRELVQNSCGIAEAFRNENLAMIGQQMNRYWQQKKILASGCEPADVHTLMKHLDQWTHGQLLVGAGGGGFMCILTKEPKTRRDICDKIQELPFAENLSVHSVSVDQSGLTVSVNDTFLSIP